MLLKGNQVLENIDVGNLNQELEIAKFRNYGRENFADLIKSEISFSDFIIQSSQFYSIKLPKEISEYFIRADIAPYFWLSEASLLQRIEDLLVVKSAEYNFVSNFREIKNYYYKWLTQKTEKEKFFFAQSIKNLVERNFAVQSFYNLTLYGIVLTNDTSIYNPKRAIELFDRAIEIINNCNISLINKKEILYIVNIYKGFTFIKEYEYLNSMRTFKEALKHNPYGITAIFYSALSSRYLDDFNAAYDYLKEILEYDKSRFQYAINYNHMGLFTFFYEDAVFYNVFSEMGFAQLLPDIDFLIKSLFSIEVNSMELTYSKLINLDNLRIKQFFDEAVKKEIKFLKKALNHYKQKKHGLIRIVEQIYRNKLATLIEYIRNLIESHYFDQIKEEIVVFDMQIEQNKKQLDKINLERGDTNKKIKMNLDEAAEYLKETLNERSKIIEQKIENLDNNPRFNPTQVFFSSLVFTIITSIIIVFVISTITSMVGFGDASATMQTGIKMGLKWGGVTFVLGAFISVFTLLSSFWEKSSEKKALVSRLDITKESEAEERDILNEDSERKKRVYQQKFDDRIKTQENIINEFIAERDQNYEYKYNMAKKEIEEYISPLNDLLKSFEITG